VDWLIAPADALILPLATLPVGVLGGWLRRRAMQTHRRDVTAWLALLSGVLFALAAAAYYGLPAGHLRIHVAGAPPRT